MSSLLLRFVLPSLALLNIDFRISGLKTIFTASNDAFSHSLAESELIHRARLGPSADCD